VALHLRALRRWETTFVGRCITSFLDFQGIDRAMALAAQAFTALIPLFLVVAAVAPADRRDLVSDAIISKFGLRGSAADAVEQVFVRPGDSAIGVASVVLLIFSGVSLTRRLQKMYLQAWRLERSPGVRASLSAGLALAALLVEVALLALARSLVQKLPFDWALGAPSSLLASVVLWTSVPWLLLDRRIPWRRLLPVGTLTAVGVSIYGVATTIYIPRVMEANSERYGLFGVTLTLVGWLLCISFIVVAATTVAGEFDRAPEHWARRLRAGLGLEPAARPDAPEPAGPPAVPAARPQPARPARGATSVAEDP
jgi:membrane protein